jgi:serine/threonine protein kinase
MSDAAISADSSPATRALGVRVEEDEPTSTGPGPVSGTGASGVTLAGSAEAAVSAIATVQARDIARDDLSGLSLGQYALGEKIGGGGMGKVFRARHVHLDRLFAIKFVATNLALRGDVQQRFEQETRALGQLQHPRIVNAVDAGCLDGLKYLVTEYIDGEDLTRLVARRGALSVNEACGLIREAALGLAYSHSRGFVHRDIKPSNLIVDREGGIKILDFGLVHDQQRNGELTAEGSILGTWDYIAPEQAEDASAVDHRCDLYSLGCTLLFLLSGQVPYAGPKYRLPAAKLKGHLLETPAWLAEPPAEIPTELVAVLTRLLAKHPDERIQTADEVATALAPFANSSARQDETSRSERVSPGVRDLLGNRSSTTALGLGLLAVSLGVFSAATEISRAAGTGSMSQSGSQLSPDPLKTTSAAAEGQRVGEVSPEVLVDVAQSKEPTAANSAAGLEPDEPLTHPMPLFANEAVVLQEFGDESVALPVTVPPGRTNSALPVPFGLLPHVATDELGKLLP